MAIRTWTGRNPDTDRGPEHFEVTFEGAVLGTYESNHHDDSDFFAVVWDAEAGAVRDIQYATTRGWTYYNSATVDATDEAKAAARAYFEPRFAEVRAARKTAEAAAVEVGKRVRVARGRKVPVGTEGEVFWKGPDRYARRWSANQERVGIKTDAGDKVWTSAGNVDVIDPPTYTAADFADEVKQIQIDPTTAQRSLTYSWLAALS